MIETCHVKLREWDIHVLWFWIWVHIYVRGLGLDVPHISGCAGCGSMSAARGRQCGGALWVSLLKRTWRVGLYRMGCTYELVELIQLARIAGCVMGGLAWAAPKYSDWGLRMYTNVYRKVACVMIVALYYAMGPQRRYIIVLLRCGPMWCEDRMTIDCQWHFIHENWCKKTYRCFWYNIYK